MTQVAERDSGTGAVVATVGCSVLGMMIAGPVGAVIGGGLAIVATSAAHRQRNHTPIMVRRVNLPREAIQVRCGVKYFTAPWCETQLSLAEGL